MPVSMVAGDMLQAAEAHALPCSHRFLRQYGSVPQVETQKDRSLRRRIQSLQCFLFEQLHRELTQSSPRAPPGFAPPAKAPSEAILPTTEPPTTATTDVTATSPPHASPDDNHVEQSNMQATAAAAAAALPAAAPAAAAAAAAAAATQPMTAPVAGQAGTVSSDAGAQQQSAPSSEQTAQQAAGAEPATRKSIIDATFGLAVRQRTKVTTGLQADKLRESRSFQVCVCLPECISPCCCYMCLLWSGIAVLDSLTSTANTPRRIRKRELEQSPSGPSSQSRHTSLPR